jgi:hypothetical protein
VAPQLPPPVAPGPAANPFDFDEAGAPGEGGYAPRELPSGWNTVRIGLGLMSWGVLMDVVALVMFGLTITMAEAAGYKNVDESPLFLVVMLPALLGGPLLLIGMGMCLATPSASGVQGMAIAAFVCMFCVGAIGAILFLLFLRDVAYYFRNRGLAKHIIVFLCCAIVLPVISCCMFGAVVDSIGPGTQQEKQLARAFVMAGFSVPFLGLLLWFWYLLRATRGSIAAERRWGTPRG